MEYLLRPTTMLMLVPLVVAACEVFRYYCFTSLKLAWQGRGGHMYSYYVDFSLSLPLILPMMAIFITIVATLMWRRILSLPAPLNPYVSMFFLLLLFCLVISLLYQALKKIMTFSEMVRPLIFFAILETACFVYQPLRFVFGGTFLFLLSLAFSRTVRFTGWDDLPQWLDRCPEEDSSKRNRVRIRLFMEAEGVLARRGDRVEVQGEQLSDPNSDRIASLARRILDRARLTELATGMDRAQQRQDLLAEIPEIVARKVDKIHARKQALDLAELPTGEKEAQLRQEIRQVLDQELGSRLLSLMYWNYDLPNEELSFAVSRVPQVTLKPIITIEEYLGMPLSWHERRPRPARRRRK